MFYFWDLTKTKILNRFGRKIQSNFNQRITVIGVIVKSNEPFERALKRFTKSCEKNGIISDVKKRQRFEKPSEVRKHAETAARRKRLKELADANRKRLY